VKRLIIVYCLLSICSAAQGIDSTATGNWSAGGTWVGGVAPANGDTVVIKSPHVVTFDVDQSGFANGVTLTIDSGATLIYKATAGTYYLMTSADITVNGTFQIGTSAAVPQIFTAKSTVDFNSTAKSFKGTGVVNTYCINPTNYYILSDAQAVSGQKNISVATDVTADIWADGDEVVVIDSTPRDLETNTIGAGGIAAGQITTNVNLDSNYESGSVVALLTRNVRIIGSTTYTFHTMENCYISAEIRGTYGFTLCKNFTVDGAIKTSSVYTSYQCYNMLNNGVLLGDGYIINGFNNTVNNLSNGRTGNYAVYGESNFTMLEDAWIFGSTGGISQSSNVILGGKISNTSAGYGGIVRCIGVIAGNLTMANNAGGDLSLVVDGVFYNSSFGSTSEFTYYTDTDSRKANSYVESSNHDQTENAFKAWTLGGIVTSQTASPPTGYTIWYEHACEDVDNPCFRQYETTVLPDTAIEVTGQIRIADAEDHSAYPPTLQIVDKFADPLVDSSQSYLDTDAVATADGTEADWQDVSVIWANSGDAPRQIIVRMFAQHASGDVDEVWSIANYQSQIQAIYDKLPTNYIMGSSDVDDHDTDIDSILEDTGTTLNAYIEEIIERLKRIWAYP